MDPRFRLRGVSKSYPGRPGQAGALVPALTAVDLDLQDGQVNALVGRSGAGKSTLARIVMGFAAPDSGEVLYRGRPAFEAPRPAFRRCNQMVFQNPFLAVNPLFTVGQIIGEPLRTLKIVDGGIAGAAAGTEKIAAVLERLELPGGCLRRLPHELSGGELQRVALARALVVEPEFLVLDEPFSALDDLGAMRILRQFRAVFRVLRLGVLFISHHPRHVRALADRVAVLEEGRILHSEP
jgi:ABC-type glutathione transport system ATPase component